MSLYNPQVMEKWLHMGETLQGGHLKGGTPCYRGCLSMLKRMKAGGMQNRIKPSSFFNSFFNFL